MRRTISPALAALGLFWLALGGCAGYASWPPVDGGSVISDPNNPPMPAILISAYKFMEKEYPPASSDGRFAINLPSGLLHRNYAFVARHVGPNAAPLTPENEASLPVYHVERVRIRGTEAQVEMVYPSTTLGSGPGGGAVWQGVRLRMQRTAGNWKVTTRREWASGVAQPPPPFYFDASRAGN